MADIQVTSRNYQRTDLRERLEDDWVRGIFALLRSKVVDVSLGQSEDKEILLQIRPSR